MALSRAALLREVRHLLKVWTDDSLERIHALPPPPWPKPVMDLLFTEARRWPLRGRAMVAAEVLQRQLDRASTRVRRAEWWVEHILPLLDAPEIAGWPLGKLLEGLGSVIATLDHRASGARLRATLGRFLLTHPNPDVRGDAVYALGQSRSREAAALLAKASRDRGAFWNGQVGAYARVYRASVLGDDGPLWRYPDIRRSHAWYAKRKLQDAAWVRAARAAHAKASAPRRSSR